MANNKQKVRIRDDIHSKEEKHMDPNTEGGNNNEEVQEVNPGANDAAKGRNDPKKGGRDEYYHKGDAQVWRDRFLIRDEELKDMANKLTDLQTVVNFMMQNNVMQPSFPLQDMPAPATKIDAQQGGQKTVPVVPQHSRG
ncbi:hypothetical protein ACSBR1_040441 [Camellia fascicularis]